MTDKNIAIPAKAPTERETVAYRQPNGTVLIYNRVKSEKHGEIKGEKIAESEAEAILGY